MADRLIHMTCCVCGDDAGKFQQHYNRDTGYGICPSCVAEEAARETPERLQELYGTAGVNYDVPMVRHMGRRFRVLALAKTDEQANAFMEKNENAGVLLTSNLGIFIADMNDKGEPA